MKYRHKLKTAIICAVAALLGCVVIPASAASAGQVTMATLIALQKWLSVESTTMDAETAATCDANSDGVLDVIDMVLIKRTILYGHTTTTPTETNTTSTTTTTTTTTTGTTISDTEDTTTTTTTKTVEEELGELNFSQVLKQISVKEDIPDVTISEGEEEKQETVFSFAYNGQTFAYTLLSKEGVTVSELLMSPTQISGIHLWISGNTQEVLDVGSTYELPDTESKTFDYNGKAYEYQLKEYNQITATNISTVAKLIGGTKSSGATGYLYVRQFDYNLSGKLDSEDVKIMLKHYTADISNLLIGKEWYLFTFLYDYTQMGETANSIISFTEAIGEGTYVLPTQAYVDLCDELEKVHALKVVSAEMYQAETGAIAETEYMLWIPEYYRGETEWVSMNETFTHAGFVVRFE